MAGPSRPRGYSRRGLPPASRRRCLLQRFGFWLPRRRVGGEKEEPQAGERASERAPSSGLEAAKLFATCLGGGSSAFRLVSPADGSRGGGAAAAMERPPPRLHECCAHTKSQGVALAAQESLSCQVQWRKCGLKERGLSPPPGGEGSCVSLNHHPYELLPSPCPEPTAKQGCTIRLQVT